MFCEKEFIFIGECTPRWFHCGYSHLQVGNPETDYYYDYKGLLEYAWSHAVISDQQYDKAKQVCDFKQFEWSNECNQAMHEVFQDYSEIDIFNIYAQACRLNSTSSIADHSNSNSPESFTKVYI